jgi:hypothetical protein
MCYSRPESGAAAPAHNYRVARRIACSLLGDDADWDAETWAMRPETLERLARTLAILSTRRPKSLFVAALWVGNVARETVSVTPEELVQLARSSNLGTHI